MAKQSGTNNPEQDTGKENIDVKDIKELLSVASHERKNLQLLVEYFEKKIPELDERKQYFDRVSSQVPDSLQKIDFLSSQIEDIKIPSLEEYLSTRYATSSSKYVCAYCGFAAKNAAAKSAHLRGCSVKKSQSSNTSSNSPAPTITI